MTKIWTLKMMLVVVNGETNWIFSSLASPSQWDLEMFGGFPICATKTAEVRIQIGYMHLSHVMHNDGVRDERF